MIDEPLRRIRSFGPVVDARSRILILGSMPGVMSLEKQEYYGHPRNAFWKIIYAVFGRAVEDDYRIRCAFLKSRGVALWDVIESCERPGSSDTAITNARPNDITRLVRGHRAITAVLFNGHAAEKIYKKHIGYEALPAIACHVLPSTSPANTMEYEEKYTRWKSAIREILGVA